MQRVAIVGSGGAGKTTLAATMGRITGLPVVHLDHLHWKPGWVETALDEWERIVEVQTAEERWIIDGNYGGTFEARFERADTVIVLARSRWRCMFRVVLRAVRNHGRAVQADGCPERLERTFLRWVWRYPKDSRPKLDAALEPFRTRLTVVELETGRAVRGYLSALQGTQRDETHSARTTGPS